MFELTTMTTVRVLDVRTLAAKNREPGDLVGAQLLMRSTLPITSLSMFDPSLPDWFARKAEPKTQGALDGIEELELTEVGKHVKSMPWVYDQSGNTVEIDRGLGGDSNLRLVDCTVHSVSWKVQEGVAVTYTWTIDAPSLTESIRGKLTSLKRTEIPITQVGPAVDGQQELVSPEVKTLPSKAQGNGDWPFPGTKGGGPNAKSVPAQDATDVVLADVAKHGSKCSAKSSGKAASKTRRGAVPAPAYRDPESGQTWSGRGLKPKWLAVALERGKKLSDFQAH